MVQALAPPLRLAREDRSRIQIDFGDALNYFALQPNIANLRCACRRFRWSAPIGGSFLMGSQDTRYPDDGEGPVRKVTVAAFAIASYAVSNLQFGVFVRTYGLHH
jgi:hypothetical protein